MHAKQVSSHSSKQDGWSGAPCSKDMHTHVQFADTRHACTRTCGHCICVPLPEGLVLLVVVQAGLVVCRALQALHTGHTSHVRQLNLQARRAYAGVGEVKKLPNFPKTGETTHGLQMHSVPEAAHAQQRLLTAASSPVCYGVMASVTQGAQTDVPQ